MPINRLTYFHGQYKRNWLADDALLIPNHDISEIIYQGEAYHPVVVHFPGGQKNKSWLNRMVAHLDENTPKLTCPANIHIVQLNNIQDMDTSCNPGEYFLQKMKLDYQVFGKSIPHNQWKNANKIHLLHDCLTSIPPSKTKQYFLFFDSSDAMLISNPARLIHALNTYQCDLLFGMDVVLHNGYSWIRNTCLKPPYTKPYHSEQFRFLNSGMMFGEVTQTRLLLESLLDEHQWQLNHKSDQHYFHKLRFKHFDAMSTDFEKRYFLNIYPFKGYFHERQ